MEIKRMSAQDIVQIAALERECFSQPWSEKGLETELYNPSAIFLVAKDSEQLAGYAGMHCVLDEGYIANIAVTTAFRRQGVATLLMRELLSIAGMQKLGFLTLEVRESNRPAISFYQTLGFGEVGRRKRFYANPEEDAVLMTRFLTMETNE